MPTADAPDPFEPVNRGVHAFNKGLDRVALRPASQVYVKVVPSRLRKGVSNVTSNLSQPAIGVNYALQGKFEESGQAFTRFGLNSFFGIGGLLDPATEFGVFEDPTDFGETLAVWGTPSGPYVELPLLGPSTVRDTVGIAVELVADQVPEIIEEDLTGVLIGLQVGDLLQNRSDLARVIDALLYESADSYAATRIAYLQNRARELNQGLALEDLEDPYAFE